MDLTEAQELQRKFDDNSWDVNTNDFDKIRHITLHLAVLIGKIGRYCERHEHHVGGDEEVVKREVTPDLLIYALQLANLFRIDLEDLYRQRLESNRLKR